MEVADAQAIRSIVEHRRRFQMRLTTSLRRRMIFKTGMNSLKYTEKV